MVLSGVRRQRHLHHYSDCGGERGRERAPPRVVYQMQIRSNLSWCVSLLLVGGVRVPPRFHVFIVECYTNQAPKSWKIDCAQRQDLTVGRTSFPASVVVACDVRQRCKCCRRCMNTYNSPFLLLHLPGGEFCISPGTDLWPLARARLVV